MGFCTTITRETDMTGNGRGAFYSGDVCALLPDLVTTYRDQIQLIYLDPPYRTGEHFQMRVRVGAEEWRSGNGSLVLPAYDDTLPLMDYADWMRDILTAAHEMLAPTGMIFLHIDERMHARMRLLMDEIFGEDHFLNEIIWPYQTGGRARRYFSRKHDIILFYRKTRAYDFHIEDVAVPRGNRSHSHMKRHVDVDGRVYHSIRSAGRLYTYYDDDPVLPGDVWDDIPHLQQKDPRRTGYETQKPLALLHRIVRCASRPGDRVMDLFAGSGTTLEAAYQLDREWIGVDASPLSLQTVRHRLEDARTTYHFSERPVRSPHCAVSVLPGIAFYQVTLTQYTPEPPRDTQPFPELDAVDSWAVGYYVDGECRVYAHSTRSRTAPELESTLSVPVYSGTLVIRVSDIWGRDFYYRPEIRQT